MKKILAAADSRPAIFSNILNKAEALKPDIDAALYAEFAPELAILEKKFKENPDDKESLTRMIQIGSLLAGNKPNRQDVGNQHVKFLPTVKN